MTNDVEFNSKTSSHNSYSHLPEAEEIKEEAFEISDPIKDTCDKQQSRKDLIPKSTTSETGKSKHFHTSITEKDNSISNGDNLQTEKSLGSHSDENSKGK